MSPRVLLDRRGIEPRESVGGCLKDYRLVFNTRGIPWMEPVFANVEPAAGTSVHGVLHRLTEKQLTRLNLYEGVGLAYRHLELEVAAYDNRRIRALVFSAIMKSAPGNPSCRYLNFLREGARHYGLDPDYVRMLEDHPCRSSVSLPGFVPGLFEKLAMGRNQAAIKALQKLGRSLTRRSRQ